MKRQRLISSLHPTTRKVACGVSAAALMLGVSQAATVGFNFQANYCNAASYSGAVVTAPAFGIGTNAWESLLPMASGYGCPCGYTVTNEIIDTTTSTNGLNPLPHGSLNVTWGGYAANVSGFGGYSRSGPYYTFGGNNEQPGNEQVYWGFIRDGVNFGPVAGTCGYSSGDNDQPGYYVDITGLKTLFTNTPFAVQLIASSDSLWTLTNVFIIDAAANTTQSVVYPNIPTPSNAGGSLPGGLSFPRGIGGGLSTGSGAVNTDHLIIQGNRAEHGTNFNRASTICGFIITDKPVISMSPQPVVVSTGDTVAWSGYAVGVPPLSYQWRKNGKSIAGATATDFSITNITAADIAAYDLVVTNLYGSATSSVVTVDTILTTPGKNFVVDSNPQNPERDGLNFGATWVDSSADHGTNRLGVMNFAAAGPSQITVPGATNFDYSTGTVMFWVRTSGLADSTGHPATLFDRMNNGKGFVLVQNSDGTVGFADNGANDSFTSVSSITNNQWHHVAIAFDQGASGPMTIYIDGQPDRANFSASGWSWSVGQELEFGLSHDTNSWQGFNGMMDDVRVYNRALTDAEVASAFTGALVDTAALTTRLNFDTAPVPGASLTWRATDVILQGADVITGPYNDITGVQGTYPVAAQKSKRFFRYHGHTPTNVVANPYLM